MRYEYDPKETPPVLHTQRFGTYGVAIVSQNQYHSYELWAKHKYFSQEKYYVKNQDLQDH